MGTYHCCEVLSIPPEHYQYVSYQVSCLFVSPFAQYDSIANLLLYLLHVYNSAELSKTETLQLKKERQTVLLKCSACHVDVVDVVAARLLTRREPRWQDLPATGLKYTLPQQRWKNKKQNKTKTKTKKIRKRADRAWRPWRCHSEK